MIKLTRLALIGCLTVLFLGLGGCAAQNRPLQLISGQGPVYPAAAKSQGIEGEVIVVYDVTPEGKVVNARVLSSTPSGIFDDAAIKAVQSWRFNAPQVDGQAQSALSRQSTVMFKLSGADAYDKY